MVLILKREMFPVSFFFVLSPRSRRRRERILLSVSRSAQSKQRNNNNDDGKWKDKWFCFLFSFFFHICADLNRFGVVSAYWFASPNFFSFCGPVVSKKVITSHYYLIHQLFAAHLFVDSFIASGILAMASPSQPTVSALFDHLFAFGRPTIT